MDLNSATTELNYQQMKRDVRVWLSLRLEQFPVEDSGEDEGKQGTAGGPHQSHDSGEVRDTHHD